MKTTNSIFTRITLGLLIAGSIAACKSNGTSSTTTASTTPPSADKEPIVYINSDTLYNKYEYAKDMVKRLTDKESTAKADVQSKGQAFQREYADYQKGVQTMSADERQKTEQRLGREKQEFDAYQQNAGAQLQQEQGAEQGKLYDRITDFAKTYAKEKGYKLVLTYSKANPTILFGDASLDVTADVVKKLNDIYAKEKK
jgi:outer membrane protein